METFAKPGSKNTASSLDILEKGIDKYQINQVVVASTYGDTGLEVARRLQNHEITLVVVTHNYGFREPGVIELTADVRQEIESLGATVYSGTMPFRNIGTSIREKQEYSQQDLIANTLRTFGQGVKVCVEISMMATDSGLIDPGADVLAVAGTGRGADTVALIKPQSSNHFFDIKIRNILAKPLNW